MPAIDTRSPEDVDMKAANAPAATMPPSTSPGRPGQTAWGTDSTTVSVWPVTYRPGV